MDNYLRGKIETGSEPRLTRRTANSGPDLGECPACLQQPRSGSRVICAVDATFTEQTRSGGVDDRIDLEDGDVAAEDLNVSFHHDVPLLILGTHAPSTCQ